MNSRIENVDCLKALPLLGDHSIAWCVTDPPYGIAYQSARRSDKQQWKPKIENDEAPFTDWLPLLYPKMQEGGRLICFYRWDVQDEFLTAIRDAGFTVKSQIVWDKVMHGMGDLRGEFAPQHELMIYATKGRYEFSGKRPKTVYRCQRVEAEKLVHPNEKPIPLIRALIRDITEKGEPGIDPFGGSLSTYAAAEMEGRQCVTYELSDHYYQVGIDNICKHTQQQSLFT